MRLKTKLLWYHQVTYEEEDLLWLILRTVDLVKSRACGWRVGDLPRESLQHLQVELLPRFPEFARDVQGMVISYDKAVRLRTLPPIPETDLLFSEAGALLKYITTH